MEASRRRPVQDVKCAVRSSLTVGVPAVPPALHRPIGQDLEVVSAIRAVEPSQPPVVPQQVTLHSAVRGHGSLLLIRHPAQREHSCGTAGDPGSGAGRLCEGDLRPVSHPGGQVFTCP